MNWTVRLSQEAEKQLKELPPDRQELLRKRLREMREDSFRGDVKPLKGSAGKGRYRKRVGRYRLIFIPHPKRKLVEISAILLRSEQTYR